MSRPTSPSTKCVSTKSVGYIAAAFAAAAVLGAAAMRRAGWHRMLRETVSPFGGNRLLFAGMTAFMRFLFSIFGPLQVRGAENVPRKGGAIIAPNHTSDCDVPAFFAAVPRYAWFVGKEELFAIPVLGKLIRYYHAIPIRRRGPADRALMKQVLNLLAKGEIVIIFPEGKLAEDGLLQEFQTGTAMLALRAGVPVIPAAVRGTVEIIPYGKLLPRPSFQQCHVWFGPSIDLSDLAGEDRRQQLDAATERIRHGVVDLLRELAPETLRASENLYDRS